MQKKSGIRAILVLMAALAVPPLSRAQLWIDFNSNQSGGGNPVAGDPANATNAVFSEAGYQSYHARHEQAADFVIASYSASFSQTGAATITLLPEWPNSTDQRVRQSINRGGGQANSWTGDNQNLLRDWIGCDPRPGNGGNGTWDGINGTPTYMLLTIGGLAAGNYDMTTFHHDVEHMNSFFTIEVSSDGGASFSAPINGRITNSLPGGAPVGNELPAGTAPNIAGGDPADLSSTQNFSFTAGGNLNVVLRFVAFDNTGGVHRQFFALNGFQLVQGLPLDDLDGDDLPDAWEVANGLDPNDPEGDNGGGGDPDGDNVDNETEYFDGTNPTLADTDADGLDDGAEKIAGTSPLDPDSDDDTLSDGAEVNDLGTSPLDDDSDDDFFSDATEAALGSGSDPDLFPVSPDGLLVDFSSTAGGGQSGVFHDQTRQPYVADHEQNLSVDRSEDYSVPAFGAGTSVTLSVDFPDTAASTVKQMIGRNSVLSFTGSDADLARDWIGVDARGTSGGNSFNTATSIRLTLSGLPAGAYLYNSFHHDVLNQTGDYGVFLVDAGNPARTLIDSRSMTSFSSGDNPAAGEPISSLDSTFTAVINSDGVTPVEITYQTFEGDNGAGGTLVTESFLGINGFDLVPTDDQDGDGIPDDYEDANGLDKTSDDADLDLDGDSLTNLTEFNLGTRPDAADTDADGANDGAEVNAGSDPFVQDTDGDGLLDGAELAAGSNPNSSDTDGDGSLDGDDPDPTDPARPTAAETLLAYWPLDTTDGATTPDLGPYGYHMTLTNMSAANFISDAGRDVASFNNGAQTLLSYTAVPGDALPANQHPVFTVAMWVKIKGSGQSDLRFFSEGSNSSNNPLFNMGTRNNGSDDSIDLYLRDAGSPNHQFSTGLPLDDTWRHLALTFNTHTQTIRLYVDGVLDRENWPFWDVQRFLNTTSIGGILRANPSHWMTGMVDDVALWKKALSAEEIGELASGTAPDGLGGAGLAITSIAYNQANATVTLTWGSKPGKIYVVRYTDSLNDDTDGTNPRFWPDLDDSVLSGGETTSFTDIDLSTNRRFYVIEEQ
ncbi:MAG: LamG-like jellyroll fold domain-containing protein [Verrucomicrobiales bacterium]